MVDSDAPSRSGAMVGKRQLRPRQQLPLSTILDGKLGPRGFASRRSPRAGGCRMMDESDFRPPMNASNATEQEAREEPEIRRKRWPHTAEWISSILIRS
jgi:hypothetical protein